MSFFCKDLKKQLSNINQSKTIDLFNNSKQKHEIEQINSYKSTVYLYEITIAFEVQDFVHQIV